MEFSEEQLPASIVVEHEGRTIPLRDHSFVKEAKDLGSLIKQGFDAHREVGARVRIPGKDAKPEDVAAFRTRLTEAGIISSVPATPQDYKITKPEKLPEGLTWNNDQAMKLGTILHKHGVPAAAVPDLLELHAEMLTGAHKTLKTSTDEGMASLRREYGDKFDERRASAGRLASAIFREPEELAFFEDLGLGDHPGFLGVLMRLAPLAEQDSSFLPVARAGGEMSPDEVRTEVADIMSNPQNPRHEGYKRNDPAVIRYIDELYAKAYGSGKMVTIG